MSQEKTSAPVAENKMGTMPIGKLLFNMSLPMMISMLVQAFRECTYGGVTGISTPDTADCGRNGNRCRYECTAFTVSGREKL